MKPSESGSLVVVVVVVVVVVLVVVVVVVVVVDFVVVVVLVVGTRRSLKILVFLLIFHCSLPCFTFLLYVHVHLVNPQIHFAVLARNEQKTHVGRLEHQFVHFSLISDLCFSRPSKMKGVFGAVPFNILQNRNSTILQ